MRLNKLLGGVGHNSIINEKNVCVSCLCHNSNCCEQGALFFCIKGENFNGEDYAVDAVKNGAVAIVTECELHDLNVIQILVDNARIAMAEISRRFYDFPDKKLKIISFVGTNGKTTSSHVLCKILQENGKRCGIIGTNGIIIDELSLPSELTTPDPIELYYTLNQMVVLGFEYVVLEASAHAIALNKLYGLKNEVVVFTNISNEHLDFFNSMEEYSKVKMDYVNNRNSNFMVVNADDEYGAKIIKDAKIEFSSYGIFNPASTFAIDIKTSMTGSEFVVNADDNIINVKTKLVGDFNVYNILSAISCAKYFEIDNETIEKAISKLEKVDGRFNVFELSGNRKVVVDFAHTPDGFEKTLSLIRKLRKGKIIVVFGCVGYSDKKKRTLMGQVANKYADYIIITNDNICDAVFNEVNSDVIKGITCDIEIIFNREKAVEKALNMMKNNHTLVLLGKGCETYQKIKGEKVYYSDIETVKKYINKNK